ncbi:MAG: hypothetical protein O2923_13075 [Verrucomicrobia bacterium]|nr:hypothetical protein [Verrucomicrobiota bacterium]
MSGFLVHVLDDSVGRPWPVSMGVDRPCREFRGSAFRLAVIETVDPRVARSFELADGLVWLEGNYAPEPALSDTLQSWLAKADGSFRCVFFVADGSDVVLVADPYGSRPIYYSLSESIPCASDKVLSLPRADASLCHARWEILLETLALGCVLSNETALEDVLQVEAGTMVWLSRGTSPKVQSYRAAPDDGIDCKQRTLPVEASRLATAVRSAVNERWVDRDAPLLLSGGYDSRWVLHCGGRGRKAITVAPGECRELDVARRIARACGADHETKIYDHEKWRAAIHHGYILTAGLYNPLKTHFLKDAQDLAQQGVRSVAHAFLFDTLLKASPYFVFDSHDFTSFDPGLFGPIAYMNAATVFDPIYLRRLATGLTPEGREVLASRMKLFDETTESIMDRGFEFGMEKRVLHLLSRQLDVPLALGLMEHIGVQAPLMHDDLWQWWRESRLDHRKPCVAFLMGLVMHGGRAAWIPKGDTGQLPAVALARSLAGRMIGGRRRVRTASAVQHDAEDHYPSDTSQDARAYTRSAWGVEMTLDVMREPATSELLCNRLASLRGSSLLTSEFLDSLQKAAVGKEALDPHLVVLVASHGAFLQALKDPGTVSTWEPDEAQVVVREV